MEHSQQPLPLLQTVVYLTAIARGALLSHGRIAAVPTDIHPQLTRRFPNEAYARQRRTYEHVGILARMSCQHPAP